MKRLICCTDGTWDKPGDTIAGKSLDSNVCLLYNAIAEIDQSGIQQLNDHKFTCLLLSRQFAAENLHFVSYLTKYLKFACGIQIHGV